MIPHQEPGKKQQEEIVIPGDRRDEEHPCQAQGEGQVPSGSAPGTGGQSYNKTNNTATTEQNTKPLEKRAGTQRFAQKNRGVNGNNGWGTFLWSNCGSGTDGSRRGGYRQ